MVPLETQPLFKPGDLIAGRFRVERVLGEGGFGVVFEATQLNLGRRVALKVLRPSLASDGGRGARFLREAKVAQRLGHPNTVRLYDFGATDEGLLYIAWEYLEGTALDEIIAAQAPMTPERVARVASQILKALMEAHAAGVVHRDIKPANIMLCAFSGEQDFVKVLDFGIAKDIEGTDGTLTRADGIIGTPPYMSPEQVNGGVITAGTDLYALGLVMAEMLTGERVYGNGSSLQICMQQASPRPVPLPEVVIKSALGPVIQGATAKDAAERYASAEAMLDALGGVAPGLGSAPLATLVDMAPVEAVPTVASPAIPSGGKPHGRRWAAMGLAALALMGLAGCGIVALALVFGGLKGSWGADGGQGGDLEGGSPSKRGESRAEDRGESVGAGGDEVKERPRRRKKPRRFAHWEAADLRARLKAAGCRVDDFSSMDIAGARNDTFSALCGGKIFTISLYRSESSVARGSLMLAQAEDAGVKEDGEVVLTVFGDTKEEGEGLLEELLYF